ncbi:MAG: EF-P lysine aminoacylase GenX [Candidatus Competibacteraceae bacterium]|nr:EF-P lysine aminoacylase GenX [Candidatus Competibacteraceae bacterium]
MAASKYPPQENNPAARWQPQATWDALRLRARLLTQIRVFFAARDVLEVDTPALSRAAVTDPQLHSFAVRYSGPGESNGQTHYLHTSPEFPMKRLLAAGSGDIYQLAKVFRDGEAGRHHNPEFTLLEWYRIGFDHRQLMEELAALATQLLGSQLNATAEFISYHDVFQRHLQIDPHQTTVEQLIACAEQRGVGQPPQLPQDDPDPWLHLLLSHCIEPQLGRDRLTFVYDYPASQAALARIRPGNPPVAERFELYLNGVELANGFHELNDAAEQRRRFEADNARRRGDGLAPMPIDEQLLAALADGLPDCAGVALGFDRLLMLAAGKSSLQEIVAFPFETA